MTTESIPHKDHSTEMHPTWPSYPATSVIPDQFNESVKQYIKDHPIDLSERPAGYVNVLGVAQDIPKGLK